MLSDTAAALPVKPLRAVGKGGRESPLKPVSRLSPLAMFKFRDAGSTRCRLGLFLSERRGSSHG